MAHMGAAIFRTVQGIPIHATKSFMEEAKSEFDGIKGLKEELEVKLAKVEKELWKIIPPEEGSDFCHRLVYHGREVCTARTHPYCEKCCISDICKKVGI